MPILATRGCPYQCTFCSSPTMWTTRYIMRNPKDIVDEIEWLVKKYDANDFEFFDLTAIIKKSWMLAFCKELRERKIGNITWQLPVGTRSEALDKETLQAIYDSGCAYICYAPESGSEKSLRSKAQSQSATSTPRCRAPSHPSTTLSRISPNSSTVTLMVRVGSVQFDTPMLANLTI